MLPHHFYSHHDMHYEASNMKQLGLQARALLHAVRGGVEDFFGWLDSLEVKRLNCFCTISFFRGIQSAPNYCKPVYCCWNCAIKQA